MKKFTRKMISLALVLCMTFIFTIPALAGGADVFYTTENNHKYGSQTLEFLSSIDISNLTVQDSSGDLADFALIEIIKSRLLEKDFGSVVDLMFLHNASLLVKEREYSSKSVSTTVNLERFTPHTKDSIPSGEPQSWTSILRATYTENDDGTFTAISGIPSIDVEAFWGDEWLIEVRGKVRNFRYSNGNKSITYYGSYSLDAEKWSLHPILYYYGHHSINHVVS